ncbi:hypothetical protein D0962_23105 [Leptolyngbyaceae cyanobacterium CCMR0082]|uniref:Uncharacterized protein n=1 Tax=Adonisia turfae CCMR0082 TaxID=2304604 RepID=A0A6M0SAS7_9CYAN|nr:hypothetical protein [Adonisia turfae]NEZ65609.1 hypothetical protein [Adonisia turfae CCMR0082]
MVWTDSISVNMARLLFAPFRIRESELRREARYQANYFGEPLGDNVLRALCLNLTSRLYADATELRRVRAYLEQEGIQVPEAFQPSQEGK